MDHAKYRRADITYARQSEVRVRSGLKLVLLLSVVGLACFWISGFSIIVKTLLVLAAFFALVTGLESLNVYLFRRRKGVVPRPADVLQPSADFEYVETDDKDNEFEQRVLMNGRIVRLRVTASLFPTVEQEARMFSKNADNIDRLLREFLDQEAARMHDFADVIRELEPEGILFLPDRDSPLGFVAQISFTHESGGEPWVCYWDGKQFRELQLES